MTLRPRITALLAVSLCLHLTLHSAEYHVAPTGSDSANGSSGAPWKTLQHAAGTVAAGDTVVAAPGTYAEEVTIKTSGSKEQRITFRSAEPHQAKVQSFILAGDNITIQGFEISNTQENGTAINAGEAHRETARSGSHMLDNVILDTPGTAILTGTQAVVRGNVMRRVGRGVWANSGTLVENNEVDTLVPRFKMKDGKNAPMKTQYMFFAGEDITFRGNYLHGAPEEYLREMGVCFFNSHDAWIIGSSKNILIEGNRGFNATHASEPTASANKQSSHITYRNNLFVNTVFVGVLCKGWTHITVENNTFINCGAYPIWFQSPREVEGSSVRNNLIVHQDLDGERARVVDTYGWKKPEVGVFNQAIRKDPQAKLDCDFNVMSGYQNTNLGPNDKSADDPQFVNPQERDYRLAAGSPAIDAGTALTSVTTDLLGTARPQGTAYDAGCYEFSPQAE